MKLFLNVSKSQAIFENIISKYFDGKMAMWSTSSVLMKKFRKIFFEILSLPYFKKFSHSKISTYTVLHLHDTTLEVYKCSIYI